MDSIRQGAVIYSYIPTVNYVTIDLSGYCLNVTLYDGKEVYLSLDILLITLILSSSMRRFTFIF